MHTSFIFNPLAVLPQESEGWKGALSRSLKTIVQSPEIRFWGGIRALWGREACKLLHSELPS